MFHQTLFPFSFPSSPSPPPPPPFPLSSRFFNSSSTSFPLPLAPLHQPSLPPPLLSSSCSQVGREPAMEDGGLWKKGMVSEEEVERGNFSGEGFSVDDLLNLGDYAENDKAAEEETEAAEEIKVEAKVEAAEAESRGSVDSDTSSSSSSSSLSSTSALSFEMPRPPPLAEITLPAHDAEELEWVSLIMEDSISEIPPCPGLAHYASIPPTQGLNEASATAAAAEETEKSVALSRSAASKSKRSKRYRSAAAWSMSALHPFADSPSVTAPATSSSVSSSTSCLIYTRHTTAGGGQSFLLHGVPPHPARNPGSKKRGRKPKHPAPRSGSGERRCSHCGVQKTPQWRTGPLGAKTLCNACGVRFKSGRLLPEYRPACSPTFVSHIHSNSHRKVLEMRRKKEAELVLSPAGPPVASF